MLAEFPVPTSVEIGAWMACAYFAIGLYNQIQKARNPNKREVQILDGYTTARELGEVKEQLTGYQDDANEARRLLYSHIETKIGGCTTQVNELRGDVQGQLNDIHLALGEVSGQLKAMEKR